MTTEANENVIGSLFGISGYDETARQCSELLLNIDTRFGREFNEWSIHVSSVAVTVAH